MTLRIVALLSFLAVLLAACENLDVQPPPVSTVQAPTGVFFHEGTGTAFPVTVGAFSRGEINQYDRSGDDVSVAYDDLLDGVLATVYVYPADGTTALGSPPDKGELDRIRADIESVRPESTPINEDEPVALGVWAGRKASYSFQQEIAGVNRTILSDAYLFGSGEWYIEYRFTYPKFTADSAAGAIGELMERLQSALAAGQ